ncbi:MAG: asparagine--tRNA ligase [Candidatus Azotimanducaceae bacterium]|uniref:Asparagine--tRNA ligase n=1 Tax=OM182 bacterium TaxID=2510334 RepID=A0A520S409_9GAMM|nr:MAG: asparagine--tRNA ligase [OM182 bacterium]
MISVTKLLSGTVPIGSEVSVRGWVRSKRESKAGICFIALHDGSCFETLQIVAPNTLENYESEISNITTGCSLTISGKLSASEGSGQSLEIQAESVVVVGWVDDPKNYPIAKKRHTFEYLRTQAHLRPRTNTFSAITRIRTTIANAIHNYFYDNGYQWINTPIITSNDCEGAGELFTVSTLDLANLDATNGIINFDEDFFGQQSFLTVSGQLEVESYCLAMSKVYTFGPTFRAENSNTSRHLAEFWMVEPETAFADLNDNADLAEDLLTNVLQRILDEREDDMAFFAKRIEKEAINRLRRVIDNKFERIDYTEAVRILQNSGQSFEFPAKWGIDLQTEHERYLAEKYFTRPVVVMNYPAEIKAFYMRLNDDQKTVAAMDILVPGIGEIIGGSQREERLDVLDNRIDPGLKRDLWWYRDLRKYGSVPHSGFGLGFERLLNYVTGMENVRDVVPFPRTPGNVNF